MSLYSSLCVFVCVGVERTYTHTHTYTRTHTHTHTAHNALEYLEDLSLMSSLVALNLSVNELTELPSGFESLSLLKALHVSWNAIEVLPDCLRYTHTHTHTHTHTYTRTITHTHTPCEASGLPGVQISFWEHRSGLERERERGGGGGREGRMNCFGFCLWTRLGLQPACFAVPRALMTADACAPAFVSLYVCRCQYCIDRYAWYGPVALLLG